MMALLGPNNNVKKIIAGDCITILLMTDGSILGCGYSYYKDLDPANYTMSDLSKYTLSPILISDVADISSAKLSTLVLENDGSVWGCGLNNRGQLGLGNKIANETWYLFDSAGTMQTGWTQYKDENYYLKSDGSMAAGWESINGTWYLFNDGGAMVKGWAKLGDTWYYLNTDGTMAMGWAKLNDNWYYFYGDGSMAKNTTINGYKIDDSGSWIK